MKRTAEKLLIQIAKEALVARHELRTQPNADSDATAKALLSLRGTLATMRMASVSMGADVRSDESIDHARNI